ncbi:hypothetical protein CU044_3150 [Streptomyces sp. L-9-10]|uniref:Uncharacterized protein n=1 Tax=Streptomyces scopuliridis RB72 TaxID=1440053 RepID=A0A2T7T3V8_9ACTN|nr:hypothetical protein Y717_33390 [Streptomyces scopuliridis RB72]RYJ27749.1 hypothetical protein CU044_3150 [Streptomyces sp. L-9-10]
MRDVSGEDDPYGSIPYELNTNLIESIELDVEERAPCGAVETARHGTAVNTA